jgi:starch-binding outer membrane protein, SusD/RagB family
MKCKLNFILIFLLPIVFTACSKDYLDLSNPNALTLEDYYTTKEHALQAIIPCYDALKGNGIYGVRLPFIFTAMDDQGVYERPTYENYIFTTTEEEIIFLWGYLYRGISKCNLALEKIPLITDPALDSELRERLLGEAKFLRAMYNFILHTSFYQPPLINEYPKELTQTYGNATWPEFLEQIENDLIGYDVGGKHVSGAIEILPTQYGDEDLGRATKGAALSLMAKTYLYHENWAKSKEYLEKVIDLNMYSLSQPKGSDSADFVCAYLCNFAPVDFIVNGKTYKSENNSESIYEIQFANTTFVRNKWLPGWMCDGSLLPAYNAINGYKNTSASASFVAEFEQTPYHIAGIKYDPRRYATIYSAGDEITPTPGSPYKRGFKPASDLLVKTGYGIRKYFYPLHEDSPAPWNSPNNWRLIRFDDILLMLAEAEYHLNGSSPVALDAINQVRERVGLNLLTEVTPEAIVHERSCEFGFEAVRFFDLVRWGKIGSPWPKPIDFMQDFKEGKNEYLPIPVTEISKMQGELNQNPGW